MSYPLPSVDIYHARVTYPLTSVPIRSHDLDHSLLVFFCERGKVRAPAARDGSENFPAHVGINS